MRKEYDFSKARPNPYAGRLKRAVTIRLDEPTIEYFKALAAETGHRLPDVDQFIPARLRLFGPSSQCPLDPLKGGCLTGLPTTARFRGNAFRRGVP